MVGRPPKRRYNPKQRCMHCTKFVRQGTDICASCAGTNTASSSGAATTGAGDILLPQSIPHYPMQQHECTTTQEVLVQEDPIQSRNDGPAGKMTASEQTTSRLTRSKTRAAVEATSTNAVRTKGTVIETDRNLSSPTTRNTSIPPPLLEHCQHYPGTMSCTNCQRRGLQLQTIERQNITFRRKFCLFTAGSMGDDTFCYVCNDCYKVIGKDTTKNDNSKSHTWPAFVWSVLCDKASREAYGDEVWRLLPTDWRIWWIEAYTTLWNGTHVTVEVPTPFFKNVTREKNIVDRAITELWWNDLSKAFHDYCNLPLVKCPFGCSEFYNVTKLIELDVVFAAFLKKRNKQLWMSPRKHFGKMAGARSDYFWSAHPILENPDWMCSPAIFISPQHGAQVLTCQFHGNGNHLKYIHVPTNPTGTIMTEASDQFVPAVVAPKTVKSAKPRHYSNSYHMSKMGGTYEGVDSIVLVDRGRFNINNRLSDLRDSLTFVTRPDVAAHMDDMVNDDIISKWLAKTRLSEAKRLFPQDGIHAIASTHCSGATFLTLDDAIELEQTLKSDCEMTVTNDDGDEISFTPSWRRSLVWVHPYDSYGAEFHAIPKMAGNRSSDKTASSNFHALWTVTAIVVAIGEVWKVLVDRTTNTTDWYGWILHYATAKCIKAHYHVKGSRNNPFRDNKLNHHKLGGKFPLQFGRVDYEPCYLKAIFINLKDAIIVLSSADIHRFGVGTVTHDIIFVYRDDKDEPGYTRMQCSDLKDDNGNRWELRMVFSTKVTQKDWSAIFYCRHGKDHFPNWWKHERGQPRVEQHGQHLPRSALTLWEACVYIRIGEKNMDDVRAKYIKSCGGQSTARCYYHQNVLVHTALKQNIKCCCGGCVLLSRYSCPNRNCHIGICLEHFNKHVGCDSRPILFLDKNGFIVEHPLRRTGSLTLSTSIDTNADDLVDGSENFIDGMDDDSNCSGDFKDAISECDLLCDIDDDSFFHDGDSLGSFPLTQNPMSSVNAQEVLQEWGKNNCSGTCLSTDEYTSTIHDMNGFLLVPGSKENDNVFADCSEHVEQDVLDALYVADVHSSVDTQLSSSLSLSGGCIVRDSAVDDNMDFGNYMESHVHNLDSIIPPFHRDNCDAIDPEGLITHGNCFANYNDLDVLCADEVEDSSIAHIFPSTNAGRENMPVQMEQSHGVGLSVVLNKYGRLLVRKKRKLDPSSFERHFLQGLVSQSKCNSIPLLYPEAMLFPSIFPFCALDGSSVGAIPAPLLRDQRTLNRLGLASLEDHCRTRMMDAALLTSTDYRYQFLTMDMMANLNMRGHDTRVILSRGFAHCQGDIGIQAHHGVNGQYTPFESDSVDSRSNVNKLAAALGELKGTYFFTHTCNQRSHFGVRKIKEWLDSDEAVIAVMKKIYGACETFPTWQVEETREQLVQSSCALMTRCWINAVNIYMTYITKSPERPIGEVTKNWYRLELQESEANLPHVHAILWLAEDDGTQQGRDNVLGRIRASIRDMVKTEERIDCINKGYVSSDHELDRLLEELSRVLRHKHDRRCLIPAFTRTSLASTRADSTNHHRRSLLSSPDLFCNGQYRCKVPDNHRMSPNFGKHCFVEIDVVHTQGASSILCGIGLAQQLADGKLKFHEQSLIMKRHVPPTVPLEGIISPVLYPLIIMNPNSNNVQYLDSVCVSRYLSKYVASIDEGNRVYLDAPTETNKSYNVEFDCTGNTKITSVAMLDKNNKDKKRRRQVHHRLVSQPENVMYQLGIPQIYTDIEFIHIPTVPLEERPAFDREAPVDRLRRHGLRLPQPINSHADLDSNAVIPSHIARLQFVGQQAFPPWRHFKPSALDIAKDQLLSPLTNDGLTVFGMRPPELYFLKRQDLYLKCFKFFDIKGVKRDRGREIDNLVLACKDMFSKTYCECGWVDARSKIVKLRVAGIPVLWEYIEKCPISYFGGGDAACADVKRLFQLLMLYFCNPSDAVVDGVLTRSFSQHQDNQKKYLRDTFLCEENKRFLPVTWFTNIKPVHPSRFLIHALLSMGEFDNEAELMSEASIKHAFIHARLFDPTSPQDSINKLTKRYVMEQLKNLPGGTPQFDRFLEAAYNVFIAALLHDEIIADGLPPFLYTHLKAAATDQVNNHLQTSFDTLAKVARNILTVANFDNLPSLEELLLVRQKRGSTTLNWSATGVSIGKNQPEQSFLEQAGAIQHGVNAIKQYMDSTSPYTPKCVCIVGDPGAGKTTVLTVLVMHALSHGLNVGVTAMMSERALQLGGRHLHYLFCLPVRDSNMSVAYAVNLALSKLLSQPWKLHFLLSLDILAIDELGQISAELIAILDIILRRIRKCTRFMGGILVLSTMDVMQLLPIRGRPPMTSPHMMTSFKFARLRHSVRAACDPAWQKVQQITRLLPTELTDDIIHDFKNLVKEHCTFVDSFDHPAIPQSALLVFGKKDARDTAIKNRIDRIRQHGDCVVRNAEDEVRSFDGEWRQANQRQSERLNHQCKEPFELYFFKRAIYEITFNKENCFSQSQLAILMDDPPSSDDVAKFRPIRVLVAPPGNKIPPSDYATKDDLIRNGWTYQSVGKAPEDISHSCGERGMKGRRTQYGLRPRIAATIHSIMGQDVPCLVTKIHHSDHAYHLWEHEQVVVLLSRTPNAKSTIFVGDPDTVAHTLTLTLMRMTQFTRYICHLLDAFTNSAHRRDSGDDCVPAQVSLEMHPFRPIDVPLPQDDTGCSYVLVSCNNTNVTYIGETSCLPYRLDSHNSGYGSSQTQSVLLRPWAVLAFVVGFGRDPSKRKAFEAQWKSTREYEKMRLKRSLLADEVADLAMKVISERLKQQEDEEQELRFVRAGFIARMARAPVSEHGVDDCSDYNCHDYTRNEGFETRPTTTYPCRSQSPTPPSILLLLSIPATAVAHGLTASVDDDTSAVEYIVSVSHNTTPLERAGAPLTTTTARSANHRATNHQDVSAPVNDDDTSSVQYIASVPHIRSPLQVTGSVPIRTTQAANNRRSNRQDSTLIPLRYLIHDIDRWFHSVFVEKSCLQMLRPNAFVSGQVLDLFGILACQESTLVEYAKSTYYGRFLESRQDLSNPYPSTHTPEHDPYLSQRSLWVTFANVGGHHWQTLAIVHPRSTHRFVILMDSLVDEFHMPHNTHDVADFTAAFIRNVLHFDTHVNCTPRVIVAYVPHQGSTCDCAIFALLNLKHVVQRANEFLEMRHPTSSTSPLDFRFWYQASPEGHGYRETLYNEFHRFCNLGSSSSPSNRHDQEQHLPTATISAHQQRKRRRPPADTSTTIDLVTGMGKVTTSKTNNHSASGGVAATTPEVLPKTYFALDKMLPNYNLWGFFGQEPIEQEMSTSFGPQQCVSSFLLDIFGIRLCHQQPLVQYIRSGIYGEFHHAGATVSNLIAKPEMRANLHNALAWIAPINQSTYHWQLLLLLHPGTKHCRFLLLDSLQNPGVLPSNSSDVKSMCWQILREAFHPGVPPPMQHRCDVPRQKNGFDCGVLTLLNMKHVLQNLSFFLNSFSESSRVQPSFNFTHWYNATSEALQHRQELLHECRQLAAQYSTDAPPV